MAEMKVRGDWHPEALACGFTAAPGEPFDKAILTDADQRLIDEGIIIDSKTSKAATKGGEKA